MPKVFKKEDCEIDEYTSPEELVDAMLTIQGYDRETARAISEYEFRTKYLDLLTTVSENGRVDIRPWLEVCGTAIEPVNVVQDGKVLFTVPPLLKRHPTLVKCDHRISSPTIVAEAKAEHHRHPNLGLHFFVENMSKKIVKDGVDMEAIREWNAILKYYGKPLIGEGLPGVVKETDGDENTSAPSGTFSDDDFEEC